MYMNMVISSNDSFADCLISGSRASLLLWNRLPLPEANIDLVWQGILAAKVFDTHNRDNSVFIYDAVKQFCNLFYIW